MSEELTRTPSYEAPEDSSSVSPTLDNDTRESGSESESGTDDVATLRSELEELRKRVSHGTKTHQMYQQERAAREALERRMQSWKQAGVDPDEIDRAVQAATSGGESHVKSEGASNKQMPEGVMTQENFERAMLLRDWNYQKDAYFDANPEFDTEEFRTFFDSVAVSITNKEIGEYGKIVSTPKDVRKKAEDKLKKLHTTVETKVSKKMTETREKVKGQGVTDTEHRKPKVGGDEEDKTMSQEEYQAHYLKTFRSHTQRVKARA